MTKKKSVKKPAKPKAKKPSKVEVLEEKAKLFDRIRAKEKERRKLLVTFDALTKERKQAKEALGYCETEICGLGFAMDEKHPLFDQEKKQAGEEIVIVNDANAPADDNSWRLNRVGAAGFTEKQVDALEAADIRTLGELQDVMTRNGQWWCKDAKINQRYKTPVEDTFNAYVMKFSTAPTPAVEPEKTPSPADADHEEAA